MSKIRTGNFVISEQNRSENSELSFNFSFPNNSKKQLKLLFTMQSKKTGEKKEYSIVIRDEGSIISGSLDTSVLAPVCVNSNLMQLPPFVFNRMHSALLRINGSHIDFYVERDGKMVREISAEHSGDYLSEFNFETDSTVIMDGIRVRAELEKKTVVSSGNQKTPETNVNTVGFKQTAKIPEYANTSNTEVSIPLDVDNIQKVTFDVRLQRYPGSFTLDFDKQDNTKNKHSFIFSSIAQSANKTVLGSSQEMKNGVSVPVKKNITEKVLLPDAGYNVTSVCGNYRVYTRPLLQWKIEEPETTRIISNWDHDYPAGSQTVMSVSLKKTDSADDGQNGFEVYLNGSYIGFVPQNFPQNVTAGLPAGAVIEVKTISAADKVKNSRFLPLNFENNVAIANPNESKWNISLDGSLVSVPFYVQNKPADLGKCEEHLGSFALECDGFLQTTPFDGLPGRYMLQIPQRPFYKAHVLCAVCDDDAEKVPVLTLHLSEVSGQGRSQAMCQNRIVVDEKD